MILKILKRANKYLLKKNIQLNEIMYSAVKNTVSRYLKIFN